ATKSARSSQSFKTDNSLRTFGAGFSFWAYGAYGAGRTDWTFIPIDTFVTLSPLVTLRACAPGCAVFPICAIFPVMPIFSRFAFRAGRADAKINLTHKRRDRNSFPVPARKRYNPCRIVESPLGCTARIVVYRRSKCDTFTHPRIAFNTVACCVYSGSVSAIIGNR